MIFVAGGSGHTGRRLVQALVERGVKVRALTRDPAKIPLPVRKHVEIVRCGFEERKRVIGAMRGCSAVIALTHIRFAPQVIDAMHAADVTRGIFMSSTRRFTKYPEETARQVIEGEEAVRISLLGYTIIRASMIYGGKQDNNLELLLASLRRWPVHPLVAGGQMKWQPVFTWDVVQALLAAVDNPVAIGKEYTIAGPEPITYRQMVETMLGAAKLRRLLLPVPLALARQAVTIYNKMSAHPRVKLDQIERLQEDKVFDISEAQRELGFSPVSFEEGIQRKIEGMA